MFLKLLERGQTKYYLQNKTNISHYYWGCTYRDSFFKDSFVEGSCSFSDQDGVTDKYRQFFKDSFLKTVLLKTVLLKAVAVSVTKMALQISTDK